MSHGSLVALFTTAFAVVAGFQSYLTMHTAWYHAALDRLARPAQVERALDEGCSTSDCAWNMARHPARSALPRGLTLRIASIYGDENAAVVVTTHFSNDDCDQQCLVATVERTETGWRLVRLVATDAADQQAEIAALAHAHPAAAWCPPD